eukprot:TRINITY_DN54482_c0_g1_i1.p1 TRINITY_DN54482_c0_g1~~TRINITY_DN54482_c0_g1_i1.p1  ORF type:complete len:332 (+),score=49.87 TRINITY_DN54482_c0_g1_i1:67-1062(+)
MPAKKAMKNASRDSTKTVAAKTDEEIVKERRLSESFVQGDSLLILISWGSWALAVIWFLTFSEQSVSGRSPAFQNFGGIFGGAFKSVADPTMLLFVLGILASAISRSSPKGSWSWWRKPWQICWAILLGVFAFAFLRVSFAPDSLPGMNEPQVSKGSARMLSVLCSVGFGVTLYTMPSGSGTAGKPNTAQPGKVVLAVFAISLVKFGCDTFLTTNWTDTFGLACASLSMLPLFMLAISAGCSRTDAELVAAVCSSLILCICAVLRAILIVGDLWGALIPGVGCVAFSALFLPLSTNEANKNPFYAALCRRVQGMTKLLSSPVSGFGDSSED